MRVLLTATRSPSMRHEMHTSKRNTNLRVVTRGRQRNKSSIRAVRNLTRLLTTNFSTKRRLPHRLKNRRSHRPTIRRFTYRFRILQTSNYRMRKSLITCQIRNRHRHFAQPIQRQGYRRLTIMLRTLTTRDLTRSINMLTNTYRKLIRLSSIPTLQSLQAKRARTRPRTSAQRNVRHNHNRHAIHQNSPKGLRSNASSISLLNLHNSPNRRYNDIQSMYLHNPNRHMTRSINLANRNRIINIIPNTPVSRIRSGSRTQRPDPKVKRHPRGPGLDKFKISTTNLSPSKDPAQVQRSCSIPLSYRPRILLRSPRVDIERRLQPTTSSGHIYRTHTPISRVTFTHKSTVNQRGQTTNRPSHPKGSSLKGKRQQTQNDQATQRILKH